MHKGDKCREAIPTLHVALLFKYVCMEPEPLKAVVVLCAPDGTLWVGLGGGGGGVRWESCYNTVRRLTPPPPPDEHNHEGRCCSNCYYINATHLIVQHTRCLVSHASSHFAEGLVPRPHPPTKEWPGIHCLRMRVNYQKSW